MASNLLHIKGAPVYDVCAPVSWLPGLESGLRDCISSTVIDLRHNYWSQAEGRVSEHFQVRGGAPEGQFTQNWYFTSRWPLTKLLAQPPLTFPSVCDHSGVPQMEGILHTPPKSQGVQSDAKTATLACVATG